MTRTKTNAWFTWEDRWSRGRGCVFRVLLASSRRYPPHPPFELFILAGRKTCRLPRCLSSMRFGEMLKRTRVERKEKIGFSRRMLFREGSNCWNNERNNAVTSSAIMAATNWIRLQRNREGLRLAGRQKLFHIAERANGDLPEFF